MNHKANIQANIRRKQLATPPLCISQVTKGSLVEQKKSTSGVPVSSTETRALWLSWGFGAEPSDCVEVVYRQKLMLATEHIVRRCWPAAHRPPQLTPTKHTNLTLCKWNTGTRKQRHIWEKQSGKMFSNLFCILNTNTWSKGFFPALGIFIFFFFSPSLEGRNPLILNSHLNILKR